MIRYPNISLLLGVLLFAACSQPCRNANPIFDSLPPGNKAYKAELVKVLNSAATPPHYYIEGYEQRWNRQYMEVKVQGANYCARMELQIDNNRRLHNFIQVKGVSYKGAALKGLQYRIDSAGGNYSFYFLDVDQIVD